MVRHDDASTLFDLDATNLIAIQCINNNTTDERVSNADMSEVTLVSTLIRVLVPIAVIVLLVVGGYLLWQREHLPGVGQRCNIDPIFGIFSIFGFKHCQPGLICNPSLICEEPGGQGASCLEGSDQCAPGLYCGPDSKCQSGDPGDSCTSGQGECKQGYCFGTTCYNGTEGDPCVEGQNECASGFFCDVGKCHSQTDGQGCAEGSNQCGSGRYCGPDSKCWSGTFGQPCTGGQGECQSGLYCDTSSKCNHKKSNGSTCTTNQQCASGDCHFGIPPRCR